MKRLARPLLVTLFTLALSGCATGPALVYPPIEGNWMYDYMASVDESGEVPQIPQAWLSELKRDEDKLRDRLLVLKDPPEILAIERVGKRLYIHGGGRFERTYFLDGTSSSPSSTITLTASWIEATHTEPELILTELWEVSPDRKTLIVSIKAETPKLPKPLEVRRIYRSSSTF